MVQQFASKMFISCVLLASSFYAFAESEGDVLKPENVPAIQKMLDERNKPLEAYYKPNAELSAFKWQTGQIIAISEIPVDPSTLFFEALTGSRYGHIGVVTVEDGQVYVFESNPPMAQKSSLKSFLGRAQISSKVPLATILEPAQPLSAAEQNQLQAAAKKIIAAATPYNFSQAMNDKSYNCSEFVHKVFADIGRNDVGQIETIKDQNINAFSGKLMEIYAMGGGVPTPDQKVLSPASIVHSPSLKVLFTSLPADRILSDLELMDMWIQEKLPIRALSNFMDKDEKDILALRAFAGKAPYRVLGGGGLCSQL